MWKQEESPILMVKRRKENMVDWQRGRIIRSTGRKDRHSKVCTAKGPRDRRVRLSAHTAIRFYDVQDRLGCDRPSKAIDWLMKEAKAAIDALDEMPIRNYTTLGGERQQNNEEDSSNLAYGIQNQHQMDGNISTNGFRFLSSFQLENNPHGLSSRNSDQTEENRLGFQSFQENQIPPHQQQNLFSSSTTIDFNSISDMGWFQRMLTMNSPSLNSVNCKEPIGESISQREPLQSTFSASVQMPEFVSPLVTTNLFGSEELSGFSTSPQFEEQQSSFLN